MCSSDLLVRNKGLEVIAELPYVSTEEQKALIEKAEIELSAYLEKYFSYTQEFLLTISFQESPN